MAPPTRQFSDGPEGAPQDPALVLAQLKLNRAKLAASIPSDEEFEDVLSAQAEAARAHRKAAQKRLTSLDEAIAQAESSL